MPSATKTQPRRTRPAAHFVEPRDLDECEVAYVQRIEASSATMDVDVCRAGGGYKARYAIHWRQEDAKRRGIARVAGLPLALNASIRGAFDRAVLDAREEVFRLRADRLTHEQLDAIEALSAALRDAQFTGDESPSTPARPRNRFSSAMPATTDPAAIEAAELSCANPDAIDLDHFDRELLTLAGQPRIRVAWPVEKLAPHPLNRDIDKEHVGRLKEELAKRGQRDALEVRVTPRRWNDRMDEWRVPEGHLQVLRGMHRLCAACELGWEAIDVVVLADVGDAEAERILAGSDDQKAWTLLQKGRLARAMQERGLTLADIAGEFGVGDKGTVSHWISLAGLPEYWLATLDGVQLKRGVVMRFEASHLRALERVSEPRLLKLLYDKAVAAATASDMWRRNRFPMNWLSRDALAQRLAEVIDDLRPIDRDDKSRSTFDSTRATYGAHVKHSRLFPLTPEIEAELGIIEVEIGRGKQKKKVRRATNLERYDALQKPFEKQLADGKIDAAGRPVKAQPAKGKDAGKPKLSEADIARKAKRRREIESRRAKQYEEAQLAWRLRFLRCLASRAVKPGAYYASAIGDYLAATCRRRVNEYRREEPPLDRLLDAAVDVQAIGHTIQWPKQAAKGKGKLDLRRMLAVTHDERDDAITAAEELAAIKLRLLLWPWHEQFSAPALVATGDMLPCDWRPMSRRDREMLKPVELLTIEPADVELIAETIVGGKCDAILAAGWRESAKPGPLRQLVRDYFELLTRDDLAAVARDCLVGDNKRGPRRAKSPSADAPAHGDEASQQISLATTKGDAIDLLLGYHTPAAPLALPKRLK